MARSESDACRERYFPSGIDGSRSFELLDVDGVAEGEAKERRKTCKRDFEELEKEVGFWSIRSL